MCFGKLHSKSYLAHMEALNMGKSKFNNCTKHEESYGFILGCFQSLAN